MPDGKEQSRWDAIAEEVFGADKAGEPAPSESSKPATRKTLTREARMALDKVVARYRDEALKETLTPEPRPRVEPRVIVRVGDTLLVARELRMQANAAGQVFGSFLAVSDSTDLRTGMPLVITLVQIDGESISHHVVVMSSSIHAYDSGERFTAVHFQRIDLTGFKWDDL